MESAWIGLAEVTCLPGHGDPGAFVNVLALADSEASFQARAREALLQAGFETISIVDVGTVADRAAGGDLDDSLVQLAAALSQREPLQFDSFHSYATREDA